MAGVPDDLLRSPLEKRSWILLTQALSDWRCRSLFRGALPSFAQNPDQGHPHSRDATSL